MCTKMERERNVLQCTRDAPTISILRSNTSFSTLIERLASGKFFNERKKIISSPSIYMENATILQQTERPIFLYLEEILEESYAAFFL